MARLLAAMGMRLPQGLLPADEHNPKGSFEPSRIVALNSARLHASRSAWDDAFIACRPLIPSSQAEWLTHAKLCFRQEYGDGNSVVLKDPRMSVVLPEWRPVFDELEMRPLCVVALRHPLAVAASLAKRDGFTPQKSMLLWCAYMLAAIANSDGLPRLFVDYDKLLEDWQSQAARIRLTLDVPSNALAETAANEIQAFLTPDLRHSSSDGDLAAYGWIGVLAEQIYGWCRAAANGSQPSPDVLQAAAQIFEARRLEMAPLVSPPSYELDVARMRLIQLRNLLKQNVKQGQRDS